MLYVKTKFVRQKSMCHGQSSDTRHDDTWICVQKNVVLTYNILFVVTTKQQKMRLVFNNFVVRCPKET